jgi:hypothetical protein
MSAPAKDQSLKNNCFYLDVRRNHLLHKRLISQYEQKLFAYLDKFPAGCGGMPEIQHSRRRAYKSRNEEVHN